MRLSRRNHGVSVCSYSAIICPHFCETGASFRQCLDLIDNLWLVQKSDSVKNKSNNKKNLTEWSLLRNPTGLTNSLPINYRSVVSVCLHCWFRKKKKKKRKRTSLVRFSVNIIVCSHQLVRSKASKASGKRLADVALWHRDMWSNRFLVICTNQLTDSSKCNQTSSPDDKSNCSEFGSA